MSQLIPLDKIRPSKDNVRAKVGDVAELARSIESRGLLEPIVVRPAADKPGYFDLTAGHRRYAAHQKLKRTEIDAIVRDSAGLDHVVDMLVENLQREGISPQEKCLAFQRFVEELGWTQQRIADTIGIKQSSV
jgi:ParB family chromosome partitioning protein